MKKLFLGFIVIFTFSAIAHSQVSRFQAMYIYNFSRMVEWPAEYKSGEFKIGVIGNKKLHDELKSFTSSKKAGNQEISVVAYNSAAEVDKCHILFVGGNVSNNFNDVVKRVDAYNTLVISESSNHVEQGAAISFVIIEGKLKYYLNTNNARNKGLKVSSSLENMALANN